MKSRFIILLLLAGVAGNAQVTTSGTVVTGNWTTIHLPGDTLPPADTLKVIFEVSDTSWYNPDNKVFFLKGYVARMKKMDRWEEYFFMQAVTYLDLYKRPLSPNLIVWQTLPRK